MPVIVGSNADEMTSLTVPATIPKNIEDYRKRLQAVYGPLSTAETGKWSDGVRPSRTVRSMVAETIFQSRETAIQSILGPEVDSGLNPLNVPSSDPAEGLTERQVSITGDDESKSA